jgi:hypothetical protein
MTEGAKLYLSKFIKHGFNHLNFSEESIQLRQSLIMPEILKMKHKLPDKLNDEKLLKSFVRDLAEAAIAVQGFAVKTLKVTPYRDLLISDSDFVTQGGLFQNVKPPQINWNPGDSRIDKSISILREKLRTKDLMPQPGSKLKDRVEFLKNRNNALKIDLCIGSDQIFFPSSLGAEFISNLMRQLETYRIKKTKKADKDSKKFRNVLFQAVNVSISRYMQKSVLKLDKEKIPTKAEFLVASLVLMAAGYLPSAEDYAKKPIIKANKKPSKKETLEHRVSQDKYQKRSANYHEFLRRQNPKTRLRLRDLLFHDLYFQ